jgi:N-acetylmuramoyl-L-alanine amidase
MLRRLRPRTFPSRQPRRCRPTVEILEERQLLATQPLGPLTGKIVYVAAGHGYTNDNLGSRTWSTQRPATNEMVEDFGNQEQLTAYVHYLFNAGATVVPLRPVGHQTNEVVLDNTSAGVTFTGSWSNSTGTVYYGQPGQVPYRFANASAVETAVARYTPNLPQAGFYPVYGWVTDGGNRVSDQLYRVVHSGGFNEVRVNHRRVGKGWVYLGTYHFEAGTGGYVEISNQSSNASGVVIADAIRFGNGMGDINRGGGVSGKPREDEAALYWIERMLGQGSPTSVYRSSADDGDANVGAPPRFAAHMNRQQDGAMTDRVFLSFHSNASNGTARGTIGLYNGNNNPATRTPNQQTWATLVAREVNNDMVAIGTPTLEHAWFNRTGSSLIYDRPDFEFGEINNLYINNEFDATILEVAFHDNVQDAQLMRDPKVRNWVGRSAYQATVRYFNQFGGAPLNFLPDPPTGLGAWADGAGNAYVFWNAPAVTSYGGGAPTGYVLQLSPNGYGWEDYVFVAGGDSTSAVLPGWSPDIPVWYLRVVAVNAGGQSLPSEVIALRATADPGSRILVVNGFDRFDRTLNPRQAFGATTIDRVRPRFSNSFDYSIQVAQAIEAYSLALGVDTIQNETSLDPGWLDPNYYRAVIWILGEESSLNDTFNAAEQAAVTAYLEGGGNLFVSGSEIAWDLDFLNNGRLFYRNVLHAAYVADSAGGYTAAGTAGSIFAGIALTFDNGTRFYNVNSPDRIAASAGSMVAMTYTGSGSGGAAIQFEGGDPWQRVVMLGFPFETITSDSVRNQVLARVLSFFGFGAGGGGGGGSTGGGGEGAPPPARPRGPDAPSDRPSEPLATLRGLVPLLPEPPQRPELRTKSEDGSSLDRGPFAFPQPQADLAGGSWPDEPEPLCAGTEEDAEGSLLTEQLLEAVLQPPSNQILMHLPEG